MLPRFFISVSGRLVVKLRRDAATPEKVRSVFPELNHIIVALRKPKICWNCGF